MLRAAIQTDKGPVGLIGINFENLRRMKAGMPLEVDLKPITPPGMKMTKIYFHYADTYVQIVDDMAEGGIPVTPEFRDLAKTMDAEVSRERRSGDSADH